MQSNASNRDLSSRESILDQMIKFCFGLSINFIQVILKVKIIIKGSLMAAFFNGRGEVWVNGQYSRPKITTATVV